MRISALVILLSLLAVGSAAAYGSSKEDLVGVFSLQKIIKLGSSRDCFLNKETRDPLRPPSSEAQSALSDDQAPNVAGFSFEPLVESTHSPRNINFTAHVIDDQSGLYAAAAYFRSPSGNEIFEMFFDRRNLTSGTSRDGIYAGRVHLTSGFEKGIWKLENLTLVDWAGNRQILLEGNLLNLGSPSSLRAT